MKRDAMDDGFDGDYFAVRERVAVFDLSAEGRLRIAGPGAAQALDRCFSMDLDIVQRWRGVTGLFLNEDASVIAIATVFRGDDDFYVLTEPDTAARLHAHLQAQLRAPAGAEDIVIDDLSRDHGWLCVVGPQAQAAMAAVAGDDVLGMPYLSFEQNVQLQLPVFRIGHCGEYEYRVLCPADRRDALLQRLLDEGRESGIRTADPAVLPLLMLEMRSLSFDDLPEGSDPVAMGMHWMVGFRKQGYPGAARLQAAKRAPAARALMLAFDQPGIAMAGDRLRIAGEDVGYCVRVMHSPTLGVDIGLACVVPDFGWVGVRFTVSGSKGSTGACGVSAPLFVTRTVRAA